MTKIFLTGATGYIGGQALHALTEEHPEYQVSALVRDSTKAGAVRSAFPPRARRRGRPGRRVGRVGRGVQGRRGSPLGGHGPSAQRAHDPRDSREATQEPTRYAVPGLPIRCDYPPAAIYPPRLTGPPAYWVQISGATALAAAELADESRVPGSPSDVVFDDLSGIGRIRDLIQAHPSRAVDNYVLSVAARDPQIHTALLLGPVIYGRGRGPVHQRSVQIPELARATLQRRRGLQVGRGLSRWGNVHVEDVGALVLRLVERAVAGTSAAEAWNLNGVYLLGVGEETFGAISHRVAAVAAQKGLIPDGDQVDELLGEEADTWLPHGTVLYGTNARGSAGRARRVLGWVPRHENGLDDEIPRAVDEEAEALGRVA
ncbi:hypothetical protein VTK73DRAFT_10409 [Phialemonium thermophilum]|uniref:Nucleoside-diphosphate-sugar epimerase n=1 Tax=Phialemonium thermophilum TaxID=223376 RepID=A0ABR3VX35_9PEZI